MLDIYPIACILGLSTSTQQPGNLAGLHTGETEMTDSNQDLPDARTNVRMAQEMMGFEYRCVKAAMGPALRFEAKIEDLEKLIKFAADLIDEAKEVIKSTQEVNRLEGEKK